MEEFKDIPGYEGRYQVSNFGRVLSNAKTKGKILKDWGTKGGYRMVRICIGDGSSVCRTVHLLVASAFMNHQSDGTQLMVVDHIDDDPSNNNLKNLQLVSQRYNSIKRGYKGYSLHKKSGLYMSRIYINGKHKLIGYFKTSKEARESYEKELQKLNNQK